MPVADVASAIVEWKARRPEYDLYRNYYRGRHQLRFATPDFATKYGQIVMSLRENLCPAAVTAFTDGLAVEAWGDGDADSEQRDAGLSRLLAMTFDETFRAGDGYVLVWKNAAGERVPHYHRADQMVPHVDPLNPDRLDWCAKVWLGPDRTPRVNVYYTDRVERWAAARLAEGATANDFPDKAESWQPWTDDDGAETLGHDFGVVPVVWAKQDADDQAGHGYSILADVIPIQDALNKSVANLVVNEEAYSRPFWYLLNFKPVQSNPLAVAGEYAQALTQVVTAARNKFDPTKQRIFTSDGPGPMGQLDPPDMTRLLKVQDAYALKVARIVGAPSYWFTQTSGDVPSGESLRVLSARRTARIRKFQRLNEPVLKGLGELLGLQDVAIRWADPMPLDETEKVQVALDKKALGYALKDVVDYLGEADPDGIVERATASAADAGKALRDGQIGF